MKPNQANNLISVIMPCYNAAAHIASSIASVLQQSHNNLELIIINDGSSDNSAEIVRSIYDDRVILIEQTNKGVCATRNRGITAAKGAFIAFLDADDSWAPDCLEKLYSALVADKEAALAYCGWQNTGISGGKGEPFVPPNYEDADKIAKVFTDSRWPIHAALTRTEYIVDCGGFDEQYPTSEDFGLWARIAIRHKIILIPEVLAYYHHHGDEQATSNKIRLARNHMLVQQKLINEIPDIISTLGHKQANGIISSRLLQRAFEAYWARDLDTAHAIFRTALFSGHWKLDGLKYQLFSLLPVALYKKLILARTQPDVPH